jgi:hypothetical protein
MRRRRAEGKRSIVIELPASFSPLHTLCRQPHIPE